MGWARAWTVHRASWGDMTPLVSILIPAFNSARFLPLLCKSIQAQTFADFEVLIIDDGSEDGTARTMAPFLSDRRFHFIALPENRGVTAATLEGFRRMRGDFWCYPGADDLLKPRFLERRLDYMERCNSAGIVFGPAELIDAAGEPTAEVWPSPQPPDRISGVSLLQIMLQDNIINAPSVLVRSAVTRRALSCFRGDWRFAQDWYLWILHAAVGIEALWDPNSLHYYRIHPESLTWRPDHSTIRNAEIRLVPLCALSNGKALSAAAAATWKQWSKALYGLWLRRATNLWLHRQLRGCWLDTAAQAFHGRGVKTAMGLELLRFAPTLITTTLIERRAQRTMHFPVSGLAAINHPLFQNPQPAACR